MRTFIVICAVRYLNLSYTGDPLSEEASNLAFGLLLAGLVVAAVADIREAFGVKPGNRF